MLICASESTLAHEADAPRAEDAAVPVQHQRRTEIHVGLHALAVEDAAREFHPALVRAEAVREILERTFAALVAHGTVERVVDEEELEHARARLDDVGRLRVDHHAFRDGRRTRGLQLRHLVDLDDADAAGTVDPQPRVIAVIRGLLMPASMAACRTVRPFSALTVWPSIVSETVSISSHHSISLSPDARIFAANGLDLRVGADLEWGSLTRANLNPAREANMDALHVRPRIRLGRRIRVARRRGVSARDGRRGSDDSA